MYYALTKLKYKKKIMHSLQIMHDLKLLKYLLAFHSGELKTNKQLNYGITNEVLFSPFFLN